MSKLTYTVEPLISQQLLDSIEPSANCGEELMEKQFDSLEARISLFDGDNSLVDSFEYQAEKGMDATEFKYHLNREGLRLVMAAAA